MAAFNGVNIFDTAPVMATSSNPAQIQTNSYPMINGVETVNLGSRGRVTEVQGYLTGNSLAAVAAKCGIWRNLMESATVATLVTTDGTTYPYAYVARFQESDRLMATNGGGYMRHYTASFIHLV
ncbi:DNA circulation, N-terminal [uncultured Caudovirales phage]|uniref:DNA circulation, N-terminal n=1 Tax=uncultured Caudovirales phage TaxID=2100421 RepID=A0A6J5LHB5_9CAUD|nr:DNA circulation, N-terminal [uncultured Caudovirales phage]